MDYSESDFIPLGQFIALDVTGEGGFVGSIAVDSAFFNLGYEEQRKLIIGWQEAMEDLSTEVDAMEEYSSEDTKDEKLGAEIVDISNYL